MTGGIEHHPNVILWLEVGEDGSGFDRPRHTGVEVVDTDIEVDHHLLFTGASRPHRCDMIRLRLERQSGSALRVPKHHPIALITAIGQPRSRS